jgi:hypothetical protein
MYSFGIDPPIVVEDMPVDANIIFCWGEIDCRCHVAKHQPWQGTIDNLVMNYEKGIDLNAKTHKNIWVFNVLPPPRLERVIQAPNYPTIGSDEERLAYVKYMNKRLKEMKYPFVDVYDKYSDKDGFSDPVFMPDGVHIGDAKYLIEWVNQNL